MISAVVVGVKVIGNVTLMRVVGSSVVPTLCDGDVVLVRGLRNPQLKPGEIVVFRHPNPKIEHSVIKRIAPGQLMNADGGRSLVLLYVVGDNPTESQDSRHFGPVPFAAVSGRVVFRLPRPRRAKGRENSSS